MDVFDATEQAYKNGYSAGYKAGQRSVVGGDVVSVVRCKDCSVPHNKWTGCPNLNGLVPTPDFYCAYGERRAEDGK